MRFRDYSWDRCQKKALLFGNILRWHLKVKIWMQSHGLESVKSPSPPSPSLSCCLWAKIECDCSNLQSTSSALITGHWLVLICLPIETLFCQQWLLKWQRKGLHLFFFFFGSQLESYKSICWRGKKMNSRHLSVSNVWWYVGMLFMLTIFRYHTLGNKASHVAFSPYS